MGHNTSKSPVQSITREVKDLRSSIRRDRTLINDESKEQLQRILINYSHEVNSLSKKAKKSEIDSAQKLISSVTTELLSEPQLDAAAVETSSFINMSRSAPSRSSKMSNKSAGSNKSTLTKSAKTKASPPTSPKTMKDIEDKLRELKPKIKAAIDAHDKNELDQHDKNIKSLATNLELIPLDNHITLLEKKEALEKTLSTWYRKVNKAKKQIARDNNIEYLADLHDKEKIEKNMLELARIEEGVYQAESYTQLDDFKTRLSHVQELSKEIDKKKADLNALIDTRLKEYSEKFAEEKLRQAQEHHDKFKNEALSKFKKGRDSLDYANFKHYLQQLRDYVDKVASKDETVIAQRQAALDDIDASLNDLDAKADGLAQGNVLDQDDEAGALAKGAAPKELLSKKSLSEESLAKASLPKESLAKDLLPKKSLSKESLPKESSARDTWVKETKPVETKQQIPAGQNEVVLRKMAASQPALNRIETDRTIDGLYSYWVELNSKMPPQGCSTEELRSYQKIIEVITDSMTQKSKKIANIIKALDGAGLSKATVTTTPRHQTITNTDQTDLVRVKLTEIPVSNVRHSQNIKQIEDIQNDVVNIGKNIHDTNKQREMKTVLESHRKTLARLSQYRNDNIRESAVTIIQTIEELLAILDSKVKNKSSGNLLNEIMSVGTKVQELGSKIKRFSTIQKNDYNSIRQALKQHEAYLKQLDVTTGNIKKSRDDILKQIQIYLGDLDASLIEASPEEKLLKQDVKNLKDKVARFSGAYKNVLYRKLENDTEAISKRIDKVVQDQSEVARLKAEITNNIKILEQKSIKDVQYGQENNGMKLAKIREDVEAVKLEMSQAAALTKEQYSVLDGRLTLCILALDNITIRDDDWCENERKRLYQEIQTYLSYITERIALSEDYNVLPDIAVSVNKQQMDVVAGEVAKVETSLMNIKLKIEAFVGFETSPEFFELDELLIQNTLKLDAFKLDRGHKLYNKKLELMKEIERCSELLELRAQQTERIVYLEGQVKEMMMRIDSFAGHYHDEEYDFLDEQLINLNVKVRKFEANPQLEARKNACIDNIQYCLKKLNEASKDAYVNPQSTLV